MINLCRVCVLRRRAVTAPNQAMLDEQPLSLPVDDAFAVEEEEADRYLCCIKPEAREKGGDTHYWLLYLSENWPRFSAK